jgi:hypothetical protein
LSTEIYICAEGQDLREGRLEFSDTIVDRAGAEADAQARCRRDPSIAKVAYYAMSDSGGFRLIVAYTNPSVRRGPVPRRVGAPAVTPRRAPPKPAPAPGLLSRVMRSLGLGRG